jgi:hypothetical protein
VTIASVWTYLHDNRLPIIVGFTTVVTAAVKTAPVPTTGLGLWLYDFGHQMFNITNTRLSTVPIQTPPETAPTKK